MKRHFVAASAFHRLSHVGDLDGGSNHVCTSVLQARRQGYPGAESRTNESRRDVGVKQKSNPQLACQATVSRLSQRAKAPPRDRCSERPGRFPRTSLHLDVSAEHIYGERNAPSLEVSEASIQVAPESRDLHSALLERHSDEGVGNGTGYRSTKWPKRPRLRANGLTTIAQLPAQVSPLPAGPRLIYGSNGLCPSVVSSWRLSGMPPPP